jgi:uncharacterized protein Veg
MIKVEITRTKKGHPALWEEGGGYTNTGGAQVICAADGSPKRPVYVRNRGHLACGEHALFIIKKGDVVVRANHHRRDFEITVYTVSDIITETEEKEYRTRTYAVLKPLACFDMGEWDNEEVAARYEDAIRAAKEKATCYHCREPHFLTE